MSLLRLPRDAKFTTKAILLFLLPIFFEQVVLNLLGSVDTLLISRLAPGYKEIATAGIANVSRLDTLIKTVIVALAAGGSIFRISKQTSHRGSEAFSIPIPTIRASFPRTARTRCGPAMCSV